MFEFNYSLHILGAHSDAAKDTSLPVFDAVSTGN